MSPLKKRISGAEFFDDESIAVEVLSSTKEQQSFGTSTPSRQSIRSSNASGGDLMPLDMFPDERSIESDFGSQWTGDGYDGSKEEDEQTERDIFEKARQYLSPGPIVRYMIYLYGERKLLTFFCAHFMCSMVIFAHFFLIKFDQKAAAVPEGAPFYWWKRIVPPIEFGTMHAVLFQMALIPLTMCRYTIAGLSESVVNSVVPLNRMIRLHIHLGYTICILLVLSTILFFIFFGTLCANGEEAICAKLTSEIMCTGYGIFASILILLGTSYFRNRIPYEVFYGVHHLVFIMYAITIAHTLDDKQRNHEANRSQTFKWFSATLLYYFCDRAAMYLNHRYKAGLVSSSTIEGGNGSRMIILRLRRPALFDFKPGQYAFLRIPSIDQQWHPYSIASGASSSQLEFYVEVMKNGSWTDSLWRLLDGDGDSGFSKRQIDVDILGPCGTSLAKTEDFSHALAIGTGTGIVPILSLYKQHVRQLLRLDPWSHFQDLENHSKKIVAAERALAARKGSLALRAANACVALCKRRPDILDAATNAAVGPDDSLATVIARKIQMHERRLRWKDVRASKQRLKSQAFQATRSIYGVVLLALLPAIGVFVIGMTISVNTSSANQRDAIKLVLQASTFVFQVIFAFTTICIWDFNDLLAYTDTVTCLIAPFADWYWWLQYDNNDTGKLTPSDVTTFCLLTGYMTARLWSRAVKPHNKSWRKSVSTDVIGGAMEGLDIVWVSRSASLVSELMPDINSIWDSLAEQWGRENASKVCKISVYVTDEDETACELLRKELSSTQLFEDGAIRFGRPNFDQLIEDHTIRMICTRKKSYSLLAFCGSQDVAEELQRSKVSNDMVTAITGQNNAHQMEFVSESYGGSKREKKTGKETSGQPEEEKAEGLTTRTFTSYCPPSSRKYLI
ncbi:generating NADPH oxidase heavy chain subunit [Seminavis robusta]|uniref:Generating NADPH oxidase heavy chain subunit n=1 Tax=Seminavis robusta TaxID=568900 RepID=A0A9N8ED17_9STRA|nr:generating NADPH oxidase heavy chain subunit [Seminavis robusta]|eukprot:Sro900_g217830.1 generating NADPH oxidase heavy chain subunit (904) ;mRNA; f:13091-16051